MQRVAIASQSVEQSLVRRRLERAPNIGGSSRQLGAIGFLAPASTPTACAANGPTGSCRVQGLTCDRPTGLCHHESERPLIEDLDNRRHLIDRSSGRYYLTLDHRLLGLDNG
jgi:hypothetical protein